MLWPAADLGLDPGGGQLLLHGGDHRVQGAHVLRLLGGDGALELTVFLRPDVHKAQVFQLALDGTHAEPMGQGRVDLQGLLGLADALFLAAIFQGAHIVEPVRQLDDHHPHVLGDGQEHLAQVLRLGFLPGHQLPVTGLGQLGDPVHHLGDVLAEQVGQLLGVHVLAVLDHIVEQPGDHRMAIHAHFAEHDGYLLRMDVIGLPAFPLLIRVGLLGKVDGLLQQLHLPGGELGCAGFYEGVLTISLFYRCR